MLHFILCEIILDYDWYAHYSACMAALFSLVSNGALRFIMPIHFDVALGAAN